MPIVGQTLNGALLMLWETGWALALGFAISAFLQVVIRQESILEHFGRASFRSVALATFLGAVSSSCSYAAAAAARSAFRKGAGLVPSLAFMFASTNLVLELGFVLWILLGWRFVLAEVAGSVVLIGFMWLLVAWTVPTGLIEEARRRAGAADDAGGCCHGHDGHDHGGHEHAHGGDGEGHPRLSDPRAWARVASAFFMDISMMWKEVLVGFLIAGFLMAAVPPDAWKALFLADLPGPLRLLENVVVGVVIAVVSFVCSVGNLPLASLLWSGGISFGGVISFIYADLIIVPLLLIYRKYYGLKAAAAIGGVLFASMVGAGLVVDLLFTALGLVPQGPRPPSLMRHAAFAWNYTTWLDLAAAVFMAGLAVVYFRHRRSGTAEPGHDHGHGQAHDCGCGHDHGHAEAEEDCCHGTTGAEPAAPGAHAHHHPDQP